MNHQKFKTSINCTGCLARVTPVLNGEKQIEHWEVDLTHPDKILDIKSALSEEKIEEMLKKVGFTAESVDE